MVTLQIYAGGRHQWHWKGRLIKDATAILDCRQDATAIAPVYFVIREVAEENWGIFGNQADLAALRASALDTPAV